MSQLIKQKLNSEQQEKVTIALKFIQLITKLGKEYGLRVIISGGYAVDGFLKEVTRYHNDIDIQIYATESNALKTVNEFFLTVGRENNIYNDFLIEDKGRKEYYHNLLARYKDFGADIYYLQTFRNPFEETKIIIKNDESQSKPHAYNTQIATLNNISYEIQDPLTEVVDKIYKREYRGEPKQDKHLQDIKNLELTLPQEEIQNKLKQMINH